MNRTSGLLLLVLLLLAIGAIRAHGHLRARSVLDQEDRARTTLVALLDASQAAVRSGPHPGLTEEFLAGFDGLRPRSELSSGQLSYASDGAYLYALAPRTVTDADEATVRDGFVLRAWPLKYGVTGDAEFHVTEDGRLWQSQNVIGRSGTGFGFPPRFPEPEISQPDSDWWSEVEEP
jgi:hypothetical protein